MPTITTKEARGIFTKALIAVYKERTAPLSFLRSFFKTVEKTTLELSIEVQRGTEKIAVDVMRGTEGNRNSFGKSSEKIFVPPYYSEYFDITSIQLYNSLFGSEDGTISDAVFSDFMADVVDKLRMLQDKIERAYEKQCADVLQTGVVTLVNGDSIDFKRKAASLVAYAVGNNFADDTKNPYSVLGIGADFLRSVGKSQGGIINAIMGSTALSAFQNNAIVKGRADIKNVSLDTIHLPQRNSVGGTLHGQLMVQLVCLQVQQH